MRSVSLGRIAAAAVALLGGACVSAMPALADGCKRAWPDEQCHTVGVAKASKKQAAPIARKAKREHVATRVKPHIVRYVAAPARSQWQGWTETRHGPALYHDGRRYPGGTPRGPALWYNNYEGGFNAAVYWKLQDRQGP